MDHLQNFEGVAIFKNKGNLEKFKSSLFHVTSNKDKSFHFTHCPTSPDSWCKFNADKANKTNTYKPGPGLSNGIIYKIRPTYLELSKEIELVKCFHGKTENATEIFKRIVWTQIWSPGTEYQKTRFFHCHPYSLEPMMQFQISI